MTIFINDWENQNYIILTKNLRLRSRDDWNDWSSLLRFGPLIVLIQAKSIDSSSTVRWVNRGYFAIETHTILAQNCIRLALGPFVGSLCSSIHLIEQHRWFVHAIATTAIAVQRSATVQHHGFDDDYIDFTTFYFILRSTRNTHISQSVNTLFESHKPNTALAPTNLVKLIECFPLSVSRLVIESLLQSSVTTGKSNTKHTPEHT